MCGEYAVKFVLDGLPMKRGVVNKKWREYVAEDATCGENDRRIRREVGENVKNRGISVYSTSVDVNKRRKKGWSKSKRR